MQKLREELSGYYNEHLIKGKQVVKNHEDCHHLLGSLSDFLDGELRLDVLQQIERHLADVSQDCKIVVDTLQKTVSLYHTVSEEDAVPEGVRMRLFRRLEIVDLLDKGLWIDGF